MPPHLCVARCSIEPIKGEGRHRYKGEAVGTGAGDRCWYGRGAGGYSIRYWQELVSMCSKKLKVKNLP